MAKPSPPQFALQLRALPVILTLCGCLGIILIVPHRLPAQDREFVLPQQEPEIVVGPQAEKKLRAELERLQDLEITQRKARARALIKKYPDTEAAKLVRRLLQELELYDETSNAERAAADARKVRIREYWRKKIAESWTTPHYENLPVVRITNQTDESVLFQLRGYGMGWTRPLFLNAGESDAVNYAVTYRRITTEGVVAYTLNPGKEYVFRQSEPGATPRLYQAGATAE